MRVLVTCPPLIQRFADFEGEFERRGLRAEAPPVVQTLSEDELLKRLPAYDGWIAGDDPATRLVLEAGCKGRLKAIVKWGVGTDNIDFAAARDLGLPVSNTPGVFGAEVADVALGYLIALARQLVPIHRSVEEGGWAKPSGLSLAGKTAAVVGLGDVGKALVRRLRALEMRIVAYDPAVSAPQDAEGLELAVWPERIEEADALLFVCALTDDNRHMLDAERLRRTKSSLLVVNVARGALIDEGALEAALAAGRVHSVALDVFEEEPLPMDSRLRRHRGRVLFGSHNASNTHAAVTRASRLAIARLGELLGAP